MGSGTQKVLCQKWPNKIFPAVNFVFSCDGHFGLGWGGGGAGGMKRWILSCCVWCGVGWWC